MTYTLRFQQAASRVSPMYLLNSLMSSYHDSVFRDVSFLFATLFDSLQISEQFFPTKCFLNIYFVLQVFYQRI